MAISKTNLLKRNFDFRRKILFPETSEVALQVMGDTTRDYATYRTIESGWILEEETIFDPDARRVLVFKVTENAVTDADDAALTAAELLNGALGAIVLGTTRYECRPATPPLIDPRYWRIEVHWLGEIEAEAETGNEYDVPTYDEQQYGN